MEMQCKERVDLLEALKQSRLESVGGDAATDEQSGKLQKSAGKASERTSRASLESGAEEEKGFIGNGTIPAVGYPDISRPPPLPQRLTLAQKNSSERAVVGSKTYYSSSRTSTPSSSTSLAPPKKKSSRSPSPEKRTMLHTLRSTDRNGKKAAPKPSRSRDDPLTSRAASLAWQSISKKDKLGRSLDSELVNSSGTIDRLQSNDRSSSSQNVRYDKLTRRLVPDHSPQSGSSLIDVEPKKDMPFGDSGKANAYPFPPTDLGQPCAATGSVLTTSALSDLEKLDAEPPASSLQSKLEPLSYPTYLKEYPETSAKQSKAYSEFPVRRKPAATREVGDIGGPSRVSRRPIPANISSPRHRDRYQIKDDERRQRREASRDGPDTTTESESSEERAAKLKRQQKSKQKQKQKQKEEEDPILADPATPTSDTDGSNTDPVKSAWEIKVAQLMKNLPKGVDEQAAKQIFNEIVVQGDEVHWGDVAGLEIAKKALKEAVVYPFLRPDLFMGLREPARGMLLFGPPGTGKTMLARAVATESRSTFFSISASSLTSKYLGESEKLVRALFSLAKALAPSIIFVDEIDSLLSSRSSSGEHEATRRIKTEFLIQWSDLQRAAAGREQSEKEKEKGDASRVLVLAATNMPWAIDEAARRRFVRRQYIPLPEDETRAVQLRTLLGHQKHSLTEEYIQRLVELTDGFSGSDITALAKDAAMGPLRSLGEALLHMSMDEIRPIQFEDFEASLVNIRPSVSKQGLKEFEDWAREFGERGG
ncbi:P-loop containing nucleoside triphosphate hydrolase protein [Bisporella sp. PMI_857]|nr:P-loop containing nucleoside triphosphate hydrolase protein [Bisporella sp. PMI_857]